MQTFIDPRHLYTSMNTAIKKRIRKTKCADLRDRLRLIGHIQDGMSITKAAKMIGMSQSWGSKWNKRFKEEAFAGLETRPRSGRPSKISSALADIRENVDESLGWTSDSLLDMIEEKTGIRYYQGYGGRLLRKWGYTLKVAVKRYAKRASLEDIKAFQNEIRNKIIQCRRRNIHVLVQDESIFIADAKPGRVYTPPGIRATCYVSGAHDRTIVYGALGLQGEQLFRQYEKFNAECFVQFLENIKAEIGNALLIVDRAPQHRAHIVQEKLKELGIEMLFLPRATPELNAAEECWRQSKKDMLKVPYVTIGKLRDTITAYYDFRQFDLDIYKYLMRSL